MKKLLTIALTLLLSLSFFGIGCYRCRCLEFEGEYFDVVGLNSTWLDGGGHAVTSADSVRYDQLKLYYFYETEYYSASAAPVDDGWNLNLGNQLMACDCASPGFMGSAEKIDSVKFLSGQDYSADYPAGTDLSPIMEVTFSPDEGPVTAFFQSQSALVQEYGHIRFTEAPADRIEDFQVVMQIWLNGVEFYGSPSGKVILLP